MQLTLIQSYDNAQAGQGGALCVTRRALLPSGIIAKNANYMHSS